MPLLLSPSFNACLPWVTSSRSPFALRSYSTICSAWIYGSHRLCGARYCFYILSLIWLCLAFACFHLCRSASTKSQETMFNMTIYMLVMFIPTHVQSYSVSLFSKPHSTIRLHTLVGIQCIVYLSSYYHIVA